MQDMTGQWHDVSMALPPAAREGLAALHLERDTLRTALEVAQKERDQLRANREGLAAKVEALQAEIDVLRGKDCEADGDGPCGVCLKCARRSGRELAALDLAARLKRLPRYRLKLTDCSDSECVSWEASLERDDDHGGAVKADELEDALAAWLKEKSAAPAGETNTGNCLHCHSYHGVNERCDPPAGETFAGKNLNDVCGCGHRRGEHRFLPTDKCMETGCPCKGFQAAPAGETARDLANQLAEAQAQLQWIGECIEGQDVSEFAESFPLIRAVADLKKAAEAGETASRSVATTAQHIPNREGLAALVDSWRKQVDLARRWGNDDEAESIEGCADDQLAAWLAQEPGEKK